VGQSFYDQAALFDPAANSLGVVTTQSFRWILGGNAPRPGSMLLSFSGSATPTGQLLARTLMTARLN